MVPLWTLRVTPNKGSGPQFWDTVYISEVNKKRHDRVSHLLMSFLLLKYSKLSVFRL